MPRRHYTPELANKSLPLVARIARDVQAEARQIQTLWVRLQAPGHGDRQALEDDLAAHRDRFQELTTELADLGVELKDPLTGLLDFRAMRGDQEVYLCWRLGEDSVAHWHALDGGFAGRRPMSEWPMSEY